VLFREGRHSIAKGASCAYAQNETHRLGYVACHILLLCVKPFPFVRVWSTLCVEGLGFRYHLWVVSVYQRQGYQHIVAAGAPLTVCLKLIWVIPHRKHYVVITKMSQFVFWRQSSARCLKVAEGTACVGWMSLPVDLHERIDLCWGKLMIAHLVKKFCESFVT